MSNKLSQSAELDPDKLRDGVEVTFYIEDKPFRARISAGGEHNEELRKLSEKLMKPYRHTNMAFDDLPHHIQMAHLATIYSEHCVRDWNGEDFGEPYSKEAVKRTMLATPEWRKFIVAQSMQLDKFRKDAIKEVSGN